MADTDVTPMTDGDVTAAPQSTPTDPVKGPTKDEGGTLGSTTQTLKDNAGKYGAQAADRARALADTGKEKATGALGQLSTMLTDAAGQVDEKLGAQYGEYARNAAGTVQNFADQLQAKNVDDLIDEARAYVKKSPGVAIGIAAALGFVLARVVQSGIDVDKA